MPFARWPIDECDQHHFGGEHRRLAAAAGQGCHSFIAGNKMKTLRIIGYVGLVAVAIMLVVAICAILEDSMTSPRAYRQELTRGTLAIPGSLDRVGQVGRQRFSASSSF
jgi:hypothetical protein